MSRGGSRRRTGAVELLLILAGIGAGCLVSVCLWYAVLGYSPRYMVPNFTSQLATLRWWMHPVFFVRDGNMLVSNHPSMPYSEFAAAKAPGTFRVFLVGGSQAMGDPYVHVWPEAANVRRIALRIEDRGGIASWLADYLRILYPDRPVEVLNVAIAGQNTSTVAHEVDEIVRVGQPDLIIVLSGNNEWIDAEIDYDDLGEQIAAVTRQYADDLRAIAATAEEARVPTYVLTVPGNLRDWAPSMHDMPGVGLARQALVKRRWDTGLRHLEDVGASDHALYFYFRGRSREAAGDLDGAYDDYIRARDRDAALTRAPTSFKEAVLALDGAFVHPFDLESALRKHARNGIPGFDLFHDFCHMKIRGYMLAAKEIALFHRETARLPRRELPDLDVPEQIRKSLRVLYAVKERKWADLADAPPASRVGFENIANVRMGFEADQSELEDLQQAISLYEDDLQDVETAGVPAELSDTGQIEVSAEFLN